MPHHAPPIDPPTTRPSNPNFSSGPCRKHPNWSLANLADATLGRSHRSALGKAKLAAVIDTTRELLAIPDDYRIAIVPASDTGAIEMALWSLLGPKPVDIFAWEAFSKTWLSDIVNQLKLPAITHVADYGLLPDLGAYQAEHDCVFVYNGTTSGVRVPHLDWISDARDGLTICDATSAVFSQDIDFKKLDVVTWSWQKALGGEGAHGMLVLSPRAAERLQTYTPAWPLPKIFRLSKGDTLIEGVFKGETINTPSMLCVEDCLDALHWVKSQGGVVQTIAGSDASLRAIREWVQATDWVDFLACDPAIQSNTSVCLQVVDATFLALDAVTQKATLKALCASLEAQSVAYDINAYKDAPLGLRIWTGATVPTADVIALLPWLTWAYQAVMAAR